MIGWVLGCVIYVFLAIGLIAFDFYDAVMSLLELKNPLWKLPMIVFWPVTFVITIFVALLLLIRDYIVEISNYYNEDRDGKEER